ncbi:uncharacterized protein LOC135843631 [Planococcus citri]|uniref:uncharacterized protein LOC135843631 n=1 Tax=Planococcus citri TaxID=170843 RepID=UPI0031F9298A
MTFTCYVCGQSFNKRFNLERHLQSRHRSLKSFKCERCEHEFTREDNYKVHVKHWNCTLKRPASDVENIYPNKKMKSYSIKHCQECNKDIDLNKYLGHLKSLEHKNNCRFRTLNAKIEEIKSAFKNRIKTYRITPNESYYDITECLSGLRPEVEDILAETAGKLSSFKYNLELFAKYYKPIEMSDVKSFNTKNIIYCAESGDLEGAYQQFENMIKIKSEEFQSKGSGWSLEKILFLEVNINKYKPIGGSSYIPLPKWLANKKAIINIQNNDQACFAWAIISALYPREHFQHPYRTSSYPDYKEALKLDGIEFPMKLRDIKKFEKMNLSISVNVFGVEGETVVGPLYFSGNYAPNQFHINLLYIQNEKGNGHYCWIKNLSRLVSSQINSRQHEKYICNGCLVNFHSLEKLKKHEDVEGEKTAFSAT